MSPQLQSLSLLGVRVDQVGWPEIDRVCQKFLTSEKINHIVTINGELILDAQNNSEFRDVINAADLVIPDSTNVVWLGRLKGGKFAGSTPGSDLVHHLCQLAQTTGQSIFLLGGKDEIPQLAAKKLKNLYPNLQIAGTNNSNPEDETVASLIKSKGAAIVLVAYGAPKQELWINQHKNQTGAKILVGVGGTFDMLADKLPRAPLWLRQLHLEWLWRLILQPSRLGRIWEAVVVFPLKVLLS